MLQFIRKTETHIAIVSELPAIAESPAWYCSGNGLAAVYVGDSRSRGRTRLITKLNHTVVIDFGDVWVISSYVFPNGL